LTLNGYDDKERNLAAMKTDFQVLKVKFLACGMKQAFYFLHKQNIVRAWQQENTFNKLSVRYLFVQPAYCVSAA